MKRQNTHKENHPIAINKAIGGQKISKMRMLLTKTDIRRKHLLLRRVSSRNAKARPSCQIILCVTCKTIDIKSCVCKVRRSVGCLTET